MVWLRSSRERDVVLCFFHLVLSNPFFVLLAGSSDNSPKQDYKTKCMLEFVYLAGRWAKVEPWRLAGCPRKQIICVCMCMHMDTNCFDKTPLDDTGLDVKHKPRTVVRVCRERDRTVTLIILRDTAVCCQVEGNLFGDEWQLDIGLTPVWAERAICAGNSGYQCDSNDERWGELVRMIRFYNLRKDILTMVRHISFGQMYESLCNIISLWMRQVFSLKQKRRIMNKSGWVTSFQLFHEGIEGAFFVLIEVICQFSGLPVIPSGLLVLIGLLVVDRVEKVHQG